MRSPRRFPLLEKLEQPSSSSGAAQRASAVAIRVGPECADHTVLQNSCPPATRPWGEEGWLGREPPSGLCSQRAPDLWLLVGERGLKECDPFSH